MNHEWKGTWITDSEFAELPPRRVFFRQLDKVELDCSEHRNRHILFRKTFRVEEGFSSARVYISADDYYKLYINGRFVAQGPAPCYHFRCGYNVVDVGEYLTAGDNVMAVHTLYQGLINRVWQSGDWRHGLICDVEVDGEVAACSDTTFRTARHSAYTELGTCGYKTQFLEQYDSRAREVGFECPDFDDGDWEFAAIHRHDDHKLMAQESHMLEFERIEPVKTWTAGDRRVYDFGSNFVGYPVIRARGRDGDVITVRCAQELNEDGTPRYELRANCKYEETWILSGGDDRLDCFDYKTFRYVELVLPAGVEVGEIFVSARHYPFALKAKLKDEYASDADLRRIWSLCVHTQRYGVQEVIQDCMEREKGFYLGDGCYTALTNLILTRDDSMTRKLIDDAFASSFITDTLVTCMDCSFMQEIAEYPLILVALVLWHYRLTGDAVYLGQNYRKAVALLEAYRRDYERDGVLRDLDKWCVVEWPKNFQHGYDADLTQGKICETAHVSINAYYLYAIRMANVMAKTLGLPAYREEKPLLAAFRKTFYDAERGLFRDAENTDHVSLVGNSFAYGFDLCPDDRCKQNIRRMIDEHGVASLSFFCTFPILMRFAKDGETARIREALLNEGAWLRMLREDATTTFESWGKDTKWNTSLFHLTMSYAAVFLADVDTKALFE